MKLRLLDRMKLATGVDLRSDTLGAYLDNAGVSRRSATGSTVVGVDTALRLGAVWSCVNLIADVVAGLPVDAFRRGQDGNRLEVLPTPILLVDPSSDVLAVDWRRNVLVSQLLNGNAFGLVTSIDRLGFPTTIDLISPGAVRVQKMNGRYEWKVGNTDHDLWPLGDLWHLPAYTVPGQALGLSPITYAAETIGVGLAAQRFGSSWFAGGGHPTGLLSSDQEIGQDVAVIIKQRFLEATSTSGEPAVLGKGLEYESIQVAPEESQFLETMKANVADVARYYNVPPEIIGGEAGGSLTYANVEQRGLDLLTYGLSRWVNKLEAGLSRLLPRGQYAKLNTDALVRVDLLSRYKAHDAAIRAGWKSRDEVRAIEDLPPIADGDGDQYLWPPYSTMPAVDDAPPPADAGAR
jgi:HK97 family phage portal protein